jgi:hypothetical protein
MEPLSRRRFMQTAGIAGASWLTPVSHLLARAADSGPSKRKPAQSIIMLWLQGGPSQLETFDPHPGYASAGGSLAVDSSVKEIQLGAGLPGTAAQMSSISLIRSMASKEGDHERGTYAMKTGFRPDPTVIHPSIGAICCHELPVAGTDIPRHVSILPGQWPAGGGYLGDQYSAFRIDDPAGPVPDTNSFLTQAREERRLGDLDIVERAFASGRRKQVENTQHRQTFAGARKMMASEQLRAFDVSREPAALRRAYGETPFGRGCLAARRLVEVGVRCVEVTLLGWDTHVNNHAQHAALLAILDPAFSTLVRDLRDRDLIESTVVICGGEFGRTPAINAAGGRDHWPVGFSLALAGGGIRGGRVIGATDPEGKDPPSQPVSVGDFHATVLTAVGIDPAQLNQTPIGRTVRFAEGRPVKSLLES